MAVDHDEDSMSMIGWRDADDWLSWRSEELMD